MQAIEEEEIEKEEIEKEEVASPPPPPQRKQPQQTEFPGLLEMALAADREVEGICEVAPVDREDREEESLGTIWAFLQAENAFCEVTNFTEEMCSDLYRDMVPIITRKRRRGPPPRMLNGDGLLVLLAFYKTGATVHQLACQLSQKPTTVLDAINRLRPILWEVLKSKPFFFVHILLKCSFLCPSLDLNSELLFLINCFCLSFKQHDGLTTAQGQKLLKELFIHT